MKSFKSTIFLRFMASYLLVFVIIISFVIGFTYKSFIDIEKRQLKDSTQKITVQIKGIIDTRIRELESLSLALSQDSDIMNLLEFSPDIEGSYIYYQAMNRLKLYTVSNEFVNNIYIKINNNIINNNGLPLEQQIIGIDKMLVIAQKKEGLIRDPIIMPNSVLFIKSLPSNSKIPSAYIVFTIPVKSLINSINQILGINEGSVYFFNNHGDIIVSNESNGNYLSAEVLSEIVGNRKQNKIQNKKIDNNNSMVQYTYSEETGLCYLTIIPYEQISKKFGNVKRFTLLIGLIALLIGTILAYIFSYKSYLPIKKMFYLIFPNDNYKNGKQKYKDEFEMISDTYCSKVDENENLLKQVNEQLSITREKYLTKLLTGQIKTREVIEGSNKFFNIQFYKDNYAVIFINIDQSNVLNSSIEEQIKKTFSNYGTIYICSFEPNNIVIIENDDKLSPEVLQQFAINIQKVLRERFNFQTTIGVGNIYNDPCFIEDSYKEAVMAAEYKLIKGRNNVIEFKSINHCQNVLNLKYFYLLKDKNKIQNYLEMGDLKSIENELTELLNTIRNSNFPISMIKCIFYEIINTTVEVASKFDIEMNELIYLVRSETIDELLTNILSLYKDIYNETKKTSKYQNIDIVEQLLDYINANFWDPRISLEFLSQKFDISGSYISRIIKERIGKGFADFLNNIRVDKSKQLLLIEDTTINEISIKVGYIDVHTFIRNFKEYEQMTPGQYRKQFKKVRIIEKIL